MNGFLVEIWKWADQAVMYGRSLGQVPSFKNWPFLSNHWRAAGLCGTLWNRTFLWAHDKSWDSGTCSRMHSYVHEQKHSHSTTHSDEELFLVRVSSGKVTVRAATELDERYAERNRQGYV